MTAVERQKLGECLYALLTYGRPPVTAAYSWRVFCELESLSARGLDASVLFSVLDNTAEELVPYADRDHYTPIESRPVSAFGLRLRSPAEVAEEAFLALLQDRRFGQFSLFPKEDVRRFILLNAHLMNLSTKNLNVSLDATLIFLVCRSSPELRVSLEERFLLQNDLFRKLLKQSVPPAQSQNRKKKHPDTTSLTSGVLVKGKFKVITGGARSTGRVATSLTVKKLQTLLRAEKACVKGLSKKDLCSALERILAQQGRLKVL